MKIASLQETAPRAGGRAIALGVFDGVHLGHRRVIDGADSVLPSGAICVLVHEDPGVAK